MNREVKADNGDEDYNENGRAEDGVRREFYQGRPPLFAFVGARHSTLAASESSSYALPDEAFTRAGR